MKNLSLALALVLIPLLAGLSLAKEKDIQHQYGLEFRGGLALFMYMEDPVNLAKQYSSDLSEEMDFAPDFGLSLLYKSRNDFVWNIGYNHLFSARTSFTTASGGEYEEAAAADEIFVLPSYIFMPNSFINLSIGLGPSIILANLDRTGPSTLGSLSSFYGAYGRNLGFLALANLEVGVFSNLSLKIGGGYRNAFVNDIVFIENVDGEETSRRVVWTNKGVETTRPYELDFSGVFAEVGFRCYFQPAKNW